MTLSPKANAIYRLLAAIFPVTDHDAAKAACEALAQDDEQFDYAHDPFYDSADPYGNGTLVPSDHWGAGCPPDCDVHHPSAPSAEEGEETMTNRKFYRATLTFDIVSEDEPVSDDVTLDDLAYNITDGPWVAGYPSVVSREITGREAADALVEFASDPGFFRLDEDGNDVEEVEDL